MATMGSFPAGKADGTVVACGTIGTPGKGVGVGAGVQAVTPKNRINNSDKKPFIIPPQ